MPETSKCDVDAMEVFRHQPNLSDEINRNICQSEVEGGVFLNKAPVGTRLEVETRNRLYDVENLGDGRVLINGHPKYCPEPVTVEVLGSNWGGSMLKMQFIGRGMRLEFHHPTHGVIRTSRISEVRERSAMAKANQDISDRESVPEDIRQSILSHNLAEMHSSMMRLLSVESVGGNAGTIDLGGRKFSCAAARGYADAESGKIVAFGNPQDIPEDIRNSYPEFVFRIAVDFERGNPFSRIVECSADNSFTSNGKRMLQESMERWNSMSVAHTQVACRGRAAA